MPAPWFDSFMKNLTNSLKSCIISLSTFIAFIIYIVELKKMIENKIFLKTLEDVKSFVKLAMNKEYSKSGKYVVNAKSIMGIFSLDLTAPLTLVCNTAADEALPGELQPYLYVEPQK